MVASPLLTTVRMRVLLGALFTLWVTAPARAAPLNAVRRVEVKEEGATTTVAIRGTAIPTFTVYKLERPERVVVDVASARLDAEVPLMTVGGWAVTQVSTQALGGQEAQTVRVLVGFARPATYRVKAVGNDVVVTVVAREPKPEAADPVAMKQAEAARAAAEKAVADADGKRLLAERQAAEAEARARALESAKSAEAAQARAVAADADAKRVRAEKQAAEAEARARTLESARAAEAAQARAAAQQAEARRAAAERTAAEAEARARAAETAKAENAAKARAEAAQAETRRAAAEKAAAEADARRVAAERAANEADAKRQAAESARQAALAARTADEQAAARAEAARAQAEARRVEAVAALAKVEAARAQAETARLAAETQRQKAEEAAKAAAALAQNARASAEEIARARGEAERLARQQKDAEGALAEARKLRAAEEQRLAAAEARRREATEDAQRTLAQATADADRTRAAAAEEARRKLAAADAAAAQAETLRVAAASEARTKLAAAERAAAEAEKTRQAALAEAKLARAAAASEANEERAKAAAEAKQKLAAAERAAAEAETARQAVLAEAERTRRAAAADAAKAEEQRRAALAEAETARRAAASDAATAQAAAARAIAEAQKAERTRQAALAEAEQARRAGRVDAENARRQAAAEADSAKRAALAEAERARLAAAAEVEKVRQLAMVESEQARMLRAEAEKARAAAATAADEALRARGAAEAEAKQRLAAAERVAAEAEVARKAALAEAAQTRASAADDARRTKGAAEEAARQKLAAAERAAAAAEKARLLAVAEAEQARKAGAVDADRARAAATAEARQKLAAAEKAAAEAEARAKRAGEEALALGAKSKVEGRRSKAPEPDAALAKLPAAPTTASATPDPNLRPSTFDLRPPPKAATVALRDVDYVDRPDAGRVVLELDGPAAPVLVSAGDRQAVFELPGVTIPARLTRALDVRGYDGPVATVSTFTDGNGRARVVVDLTQPAKPSINKKGNQLTIDFARPMVAKAEPPKPAKGDPAKDTGAISYNAPIVGGYGVATTPVTAQTVAQQRASVRGQRIEIDVVDADIHNLMRLIAQAGNVDVIIPEDVRGNVTVRLTRVPWRQAMEVILESKGLWYKQDGNIIRVATRKDLDAEEQAERERQRSRVQEERPETEIFTLNYANAGEVLAQVTPLLSPRGKAVIDTRTNSLVLTDISGNRGGILRLLRRLDTQTPQIQIEARVVEARSTWRRQLGIQWGFSGIASAGTGNPTGLVFPNTVGVAGGNDASGTPLGGLFTSTPNFAVNLPAATGLGSGGSIGFTFGSLSGNFNVALRLSAAEDTGTVRIISAPKITVLNNRPASISQGVSIPISVVSAAGVQTQFVPADLSLTTTPHVSQRDCSIQLDIDVKKNEADFVNTGARGDPSILRKEARTTMLIGDGETSVIGGIYTRNTGLSYSKVPWFADIPILGILFKNRRENDERTEVLIFLTPRITNKASLNCEPPPPGR